MPQTRSLWFDVATLADRDISPPQAALLVRRIRQVRMARVLYGSDALSPLTMHADQRKQIAIDFLRHGREGNRAAAERLLAPDARHHNPYFAAGMPALLDAMVSAAKSAPDRASEVKRVIADGEYVMVHSHVRHRPAEPGVAVVHIFRFEGAHIAELWDVGQPIPAENPNRDGMF